MPNQPGLTVVSKTPGVHRDNIDHNSSSTTQLVLYMGKQYRLGSREMKNLYQGVELLTRNQTSAF